MIGRLLSPAILEAATSSPQRVMAFVELDHPDGWVRVHSGLGDRVYNGETYLGIGELGGIGNVSENANSSANRLKMTLKIHDILLLAQIYNTDFVGRDCYVHLVAFDEDRQIVGGHNFLFDGEIVNVDVQRGDPDKDIPSTVAITCSDWYERWSTAPNNARTTDSAQQYLYPGDRFFDLVEIIAGSPLHTLPFKRGTADSGGRGGYRGGWEGPREEEP